MSPSTVPDHVTRIRALREEMVELGSLCLRLEERPHHRELLKALRVELVTLSTRLKLVEHAVNHVLRIPAKETPA